MITRRKFTWATGMALGLGANGGTHAQLSSKNVRLLVGYPAGGSTDIVARALAERLRGSYAPAVLVENKPGAGSRLAIQEVRNSEPDGNSVLFTATSPLTRKR